MGLLSWLIAVPFLTMVAVLFVPDRHWRAIRWISLAGTGLGLVLTAVVTWRYWVESQADLEGLRTATLTKLYLVERFTWFEPLGIQYYLGIDGISVSMVILTALIIFCGVLASWNVETRTKEFFALLLLLVAGVFGVFLTYDLFLFFMFYELAVLPMYLLIGIWGTGPKEYAAMKLTIMLLAGSAFVLVGMLALFHESGLHTFDLQQLATVDYSDRFQWWFFPMIFVGFGVLGALFPFHTWSPDGHSSAPTAVSMLHAGVLMKLGGYGALRIAVYLLPEGAKDWGLFFMGLTTINILYGSFGAVMQKDLKYFTAYSSVSHCGFVLFGVATLNLMGFKGAVLQMFSHGIMTGLFFGLIGMVYGRTHTRVIPDMGGLAKVMPWLATCFYIAGLASLGLPGLAGFVAETHVFLGGFFGNPWSSTIATRVLTVITTLSIVVTAVYVLRGLAMAFQGPIKDPHFEELTDATLTEKLATGILVATLLVAGLFPWLLIDLIEPSLYPFINRLQDVAAAGLMGGIVKVTGYAMIIAIPELIVIATAFAILVSDLFMTENSRRALAPMAAIGLALGLVVTVLLVPTSGELLGGRFVMDPVAWWFKILFMLSAFIAVILSMDTLDGRARVRRRGMGFRGEYYAILLSSVIGMMLIVSSRELATLFVSLEIATLPLFVLAAWRRDDPKSGEAGLKYVILGSLASAFIVYGFGILYGLAGSTRLDVIAAAVSGTYTPAFLLAVALVLAGTGFKLTVVPFHLWAADVYQGAPTIVTAWLSVASKAAGLAFAFQILYGLFGAWVSQWGAMIALLAALTMTLGNLVAIVQHDIKRFMAFSAISQAGYFLLGFLGQGSEGVPAMLYYLIVYAVSNLAVFAAIVWFENETGKETIEDYRGLSLTNPLMALGMMVALFSLAGIPPLSGFVGKFFLFSIASKAGYHWLVALAAVNSTISLYYYLRVVRQMYIEPADSEVPVPRRSPIIGTTLALLAIAIIALGVIPTVYERIHATTIAWLPTLPIL